jgi:anti-sigma B factor antagonist
MEQLSITEKKGPNYMLLDVTGTINSYTFNDFQNRVYSYIEKADLIVEMSKVTNLSSAGLGVLMTAHEDAIEKEHRLYIMRPSEVVKLALQSTGFLSTFNVISTVSEIS